jgi:hypothetical protein
MLSLVIKKGLDDNATLWESSRRSRAPGGPLTKRPIPFRGISVTAEFQDNALGSGMLPNIVYTR